MAILVANQGSLTLTAVEQTVGAVQTAVKTFILQVDLNNMVAGDVIEIRCYTKTAGTGGTARLAWNQSFADSQSGSPVYISVPTCSPYSLEFRMIQPTGTGKAVDYVLFSID